MEKLYRIKKRKMSPDVIEKKIGGSKDTWKVFLVPIGHRNDMTAHRVITYLEQMSINDTIKVLF